MKNTILVLFAAAFSTILSAQSKADITFGVSAVCGMCEERIETAFDVKGIVMADYDLKSKKLNVVYKTKVFPDVLDVHRIAANVGHDTEKVKATDEAYNSLHHCCKYREGAKECFEGIDPE